MMNHLRSQIRRYATKRTSLSTLKSLYASSTPITVITAYDYPTALHSERAGVDITLVGDSLGMVCLGQMTTQAVTLDQMIHHAKAARRAVKSSLLVADMPFGTYESCKKEAVDNAIRIVKETGVDAVKLEGGRNRADTVHEIVDSGVAVMGHVGLLPQAVSRVGAFRSFGRNASEAREIILDAKALEEAGVFSMVVECVPSRIAELVTSSVSVPTIGIGSGSSCSGQVLVYHDLLGILSHPHHHNVSPKFCKPFADLGPLIDDAIRRYCSEVRSRTFPCPKYSPYIIPDEEFHEVEEFCKTFSQTSHKTLIDSESPDDTSKLY